MTLLMWGHNDKILNSIEKIMINSNKSLITVSCNFKY